MTFSPEPAASPGGTAAAPAGLEAAVALLGRVGFCRSPSFAPDGTRLACVSNLGGVPQVWITAVDGGWPTLVTALDDQVLEVSWSPDGAWLAFVLAPGGGMNSQVYLVRPDGSDLRRLTPGGRENNWLGPWTHDGRALAVASNMRRPEAMDVFLVDVASGTFRPGAHSSGIGNFTDLSRDGRRVLLYGMENRGDDNIFLVDLASGAQTLLTPHEGPGTFDQAHFSPDGQTVYLLSNKDRELAAFARIALTMDGQTGPLEVLAARDDAELEELAVTEDGTTAALIWNAAGRSELSFFDLGSGAETAGPALPAEAAGSATFSRDGRRLALAVSGAAAPSDIWVHDVHGGRPQQVTRTPHPGVDLAALVRPELVRFPAHDGLELSGWLYRPAGAAGPGPLVLSFHGGPEAQERPFFNSTYQALLAQGIAVFAPNVRGSSGFGKTFVNLDNGPLRVDAVRDIGACLDCVAAWGAADPARIGIMGGSYGGYMTMAGLAEYPDRFAAGANLFGVVNFETFFAHTEPWMAAISKVEYGDPATQGDLLRALSPIHKIDRVRAAVIVLHGANDTNVPVIEAEQVVANLRARGVPVEYILFPDEGHGFQKTANRIAATVAIVRWFATHLRAGAGSAPG